MEEFVKAVTNNLKSMTTEIREVTPYIKEIKGFLFFMDDDDSLKNDKTLKLLETELKTIQCKLKVAKDAYALNIFTLNADSPSYTKRLRQFKRHLTEYLDCFSDLDDFKLNEDLSYEDILSPQSFAVIMKEYGREEFYRQFCISQQDLYNNFCSEGIIEFISSNQWRRHRGKPAY